MTREKGFILPYITTSIGHYSAKKLGSVTNLELTNRCYHHRHFERSEKSQTITVRTRADRDFSPIKIGIEITDWMSIPPQLP
ncbi:MAG: hypothetical protein ABJP45_04585 [Cyclobacteriaceae bacterium]